MKKALITGITGQDGAYLAQLLLEKGYDVYGTYRHTSTLSFWRIKELGIHEDPHLHLRECDLTDLGNCIRILELTEPEEVYNQRPFDHVRITYKKEIKLGDELCCKYTKQNEKHIIVIENKITNVLHSIIEIY